MPDAPIPTPRPTAPNDTDADRRLVRRLRDAVVVTLVTVAVVAGLMAATVVALHDDLFSRNRVMTQIDIARDAAIRAAELAGRLNAIDDPKARALAVRRLARVRDEFVRTFDALPRQLGNGMFGDNAAARAVFESAPHRLDAQAAGFVRLLDALGTARDPGFRHMLGDQLQKAAWRRFRQGFGALQTLHAEQTGRFVESFRIAMLGLSGVSVLGLLGLWLLRYPSVVRGLYARTRALVAANDALRCAALSDALTGLPNRDALLHEVGARLAEGRAVAVLHFDLQRFGMVNDTLGREIGDQLLCHAAAVIGAAAGPRDMIARVTGDDFVLLPHSAAGAAPTRALAARVLADLARPVTIQGHDLSAQAMVGIAAMAPADAHPVAPPAPDQIAARAERLLTDAEIALAAAPANGGCASFTTQMRQRLQIRRTTAQQLLRALERDEIQPFFQPQICAQTGRFTGLEVLARWHHPTRGVLAPAEFLDVAEGANLGLAVNDAVASRALAHLAAWRARGLDVPGIGLNFTADHLRGTGVVDRLVFDVDRAGLTPADVVVEVLESALITDTSDPILTTVTGLSRAGFRIDIDDFGTGHASFLNLRLLAPNRLKIDRSFVRGVSRDAELRKMTEAMIRLASTLGIESLAEGVETVEEWALLTRLGCTALQGFAIGHPMRAEDVPHWVARHAADLSAGRLIRVA